jgi:hypothetical protein
MSDASEVAVDAGLSSAYSPDSAAFSVTKDDSGVSSATTGGNVGTISLPPGFAFRLNRLTFFSVSFSDCCCDGTKHPFELIARARRSAASKAMSEVSFGGGNGGAGTVGTISWDSTLCTSIVWSGNRP